jgi:hypothetical protein
MQGGKLDPDGPKWRRHWNKTWRRKTSEATEYQYLIQETLALVDLSYGGKLQIPTADLRGIALTMVFFIPEFDLVVRDRSHFKGRDVSNYVKLIEDAVFEYLARTDGLTFPSDKNKIPDAADLEPHANKRLSWDDQWHIWIILSNDSCATDPVYHKEFVIEPGITSQWQPVSA